MSDFFVDTSALAKRYTKEVGTRWVRSWIRPSAGNVIVISELAMVEMFSLLARRKHDGEISARSAAYLRRAFLAHLRSDYAVVKIESSILVQSRDLVTKYVAQGLRTLDAIHLACAIQSQIALGQPLTFVSADIKLLACAKAEGFTIDDPRLHP